MVLQVRLLAKEKCVEALAGEIGHASFEHLRRTSLTRNEMIVGGIASDTSSLRDLAMTLSLFRDDAQSQLSAH
jgi:hypothetical protein